MAIFMRGREDDGRRCAGLRPASPDNRG
jgi:hypothetical protein